MKKKILLINLIVYSTVISFSVLPKEIESYSRENKICKNVRKQVGSEKNCKKKNREVCEDVIDWNEDIDIRHIEKCHNEEYEEVPIYKEVEECHTESEWDTRETGKYVIDGVKPVMEEYAKNIEDAIKKEEPTFIDGLVGFFKGTGAKAQRDARAKATADKMKQVMEEDARNNGTDIRDNPTIFDSKKDGVVKDYKDADKVVDVEKARAINKSADSSVVREYHRRYNSVDRTASLYKNEFAYNPYAEPIKVEDERSITDEMKKLGKPIFIVPKVEKEKEEDDDRPIYRYYNLEYNSNGADSGTVPRTENKREQTYVKVAENYGNLIKEGYKFVGWNTESNGSGTSYKSGESIRLNSDIVLYAKWQKVEKIEVAPKPVIPKETNKYSISFLANEYSTLKGNANFLIDEKTAITNVPEVIVDKGYILKGFKDNNEVVRTKEEVEKLVPTDNMSFVVVTEKDPNAKISVPMVMLEPSIHAGKPSLIYNEIEVYVGDEVNIDDVVSSNNIEVDGYIKMWIRKPDTSNVGKASGTIKMYDAKNRIGWDDFPEVNTITVIAKPVLEYKNNRTKSINKPISFEDVVSNKLDDRYIISITNDIDISTIGRKTVELSIKDTKTGRIFTGFTTDILLTEEMDEINWKEKPNVYVGEGTNVEYLVDNIPSKYKVSIKIPVDSSSVGDNKPVIITITNPTSGSSWEITKYIDVISEPSLKGNLWIYQNYKYPDAKGKEFINKISVDLNERYNGRYIVSFVSSGDVSRLGNVDFSYRITDTWKNRDFIKTIKVEVREENINPDIKQRLEFNIGHIINSDEIVSGVDEENYEIKIENKDEIDAGRFTEGEKILKLKIISKQTDKIWEYDVKVKYVVKNIDLGILYWEKGDKLTLDDIKKYKNIEEDAELEVLSGELRYDKIEEYNLELKIKYKDGAYSIAKVQVSIVENKSIIDIKRINESNKIHIITQIDNVSSKLNRGLNNLNTLSKANGLWLEQTNSVHKYINDAKGNINGLKVGYDAVVLNDNIIGMYLGYDNLRYRLSDYTKQNMLHLGLYAGKVLAQRENKKYYLGLVAQYTNIFGDIYVKNINKESVKYASSSHNIVLNGFVGARKQIRDDFGMSFNIGNTILYQFNSKLKNPKNDIKHFDNITNEIYSELMMNKRYGKFDLYTSAKLGYLYGKDNYLLNGIKFNFDLRRLNIFGKIGVDYSITDNSNLILETYIKNQYDIYKFNGGTKLNYEYRW